MKVAVVRATPKTITEDYSRAMEMSGYKLTRDIILKLNLSWSMYYPACSTQPWQLDGVLQKLRKDGYSNIHPVEHKTVVTDVWKGAKGNRWLPVLEKNGLKYEPLTETKWVRYRPKAQMLALDRLFPDGHRIPQKFIGKSVVHLPTLKTHGHTTMTGAVKNAFGGLITERRHHSHRMIHEVLVDLLAIQKEIHPKMLNVMDGTVCGNGRGPRTMEIQDKGYVLASSDPVAIDAVSAKMMGFDPLKIKFIRMAHDLGLGCGDVSQLDIVGEDIRRVNFRFHTGKSPVIFWDQALRNSKIEPLLFRTGLFKACVFGSAFYHDYLWYNLVGRRRIRRFMNTRWGKLFSQYPVNKL